MAGNGLLHDDRRTASRLALELHALLRESPAWTKVPLRQAALRELVYLCGEERLLASSTGVPPDDPTLVHPDHPDSNLDRLREAFRAAPAIGTHEGDGPRAEWGGR